MSKIPHQISLSSDARTQGPSLTLEHNDYIEEAGSQLKFFLSTHIIALIRNHFNVPVLYPFIQHCSLLVPWLPLLDEFLLHWLPQWTSLVHSPAHTLDQTFWELCMQLTCKSCSNADSNSIGLRDRTLGLLVSAISQVILCPGTQTTLWVAKP